MKEEDITNHKNFPVLIYWIQRTLYFSSFSLSSYIIIHGPMTRSSKVYNNQLNLVLNLVVVVSSIVIYLTRYNPLTIVIHYPGHSILILHHLCSPALGRRLVLETQTYTAELLCVVLLKPYSVKVSRHYRAFVAELWVEQFRGTVR